mmetsp:Transcript_27234/g.62708  ORF Transcript_27234/g.62708 Transcript_27234/m.62708 type:complete len:104 (-) Transcript_27234:433-744(-)
MTLEQDSGNFAVPPARLVDALLAARLGNEGTLDIGEFLARVFGGCMAFSEFALADGASLDSGLPGAGGGSMGEDEQILQRQKAKIRARWAERRSAGAQTLASR